MFRTILIAIMLVAFTVSCERSQSPTDPTADLGQLNVSVTCNPDSLTDSNPNAASIITATLTDPLGNPSSSGILVTFSTTLGKIEPSALTDDQGRAIVGLVPDGEYGIAEITATAETLRGSFKGGAEVCMVDPSLPIFIGVTADPLFISVHGVGGSETSLITATICNGIGEPVNEEQMVFFQVLVEPPPPAGCIINGVGQLDSVETVEGIAIAGLNSGTVSGSKLIRIYTWQDEGRRDTVSATLGAVVVTSGPPHVMNLDINHVGADIGGSVWGVEVSTIVHDIHRNPVADNIPIMLTVDPEVATISTGYTGNMSRNGIPTRGVAYSQLIYNSMHTFDTLTVTAQVNTLGGLIEAEREFVLPLQRGKLQLNVNPTSWMFDAPNHEECTICCWAVLKDGHGTLINNAPVLFNASKGYLAWYNYFQPPRYRLFDALADPPECAIKYTGWRADNGHREHLEPPGTATVYLRGIQWDFFLDDWTEEVIVQIDASVEDYPDVLMESAWVAMTRHP